VAELPASPQFGETRKGFVLALGIAPIAGLDEQPSGGLVGIEIVLAGELVSADRKPAAVGQNQQQAQEQPTAADAAVADAGGAAALQIRAAFGTCVAAGGKADQIKTAAAAQGMIVDASAAPGKVQENESKERARCGNGEGGGHGGILPQAEDAVFGKALGGDGMRLFGGLDDEVVGDEHDAGDEAFAGGAGFVLVHHGGDAAEAGALEADVGLLKVGGLAVGEVVADLADEVDVVVDILAKEAHAVGDVGPGAEGFEGPAGADEAVYGLGVIDEAGAEEEVEDIVEKRHGEEGNAAVGFALEVGDEPRGVSAEMGEGLELAASGHRNSKKILVASLYAMSSRRWGKPHPTIGTETNSPAGDVEVEGFGEEFGDVFDGGALAAAVAHSGDVHGAAGVVADGDVGVGGGDAVDLVFDDCAGDGRIFDGEGAAEAAALVGFLHGGVADVADLLEEADAFILDAQAAEVAGVVVGEMALGREREFGEVDLEDFVEELDELVGAAGEVMQAVFPGVIAVEQVLEVLADHGAATAAGGDDVFVGFEDFDHALGQLASFGLKAVVVEGLAAAGLGLGEGDGAAEMLEDFGDGDADVGIELVGEAGDEEGDVGVHGRGGMVGEEGRSVNGIDMNIEHPTLNIERRNEGKLAAFAVSSRGNERAGTMVGAVVLGEEASVAAVELLCLLSEGD
jgi:hypothetical protein